MTTPNDITVLNIDDNAYEVADLSEEAQALVEVYNNWNRKENDVRGELAILQAAKQTLSNQIVTKVREETAVTDDAPAANVTEPEGSSEADQGEAAE